MPPPKCPRNRPILKKPKILKDESVLKIDVQIKIQNISGNTYIPNAPEPKFKLPSLPIDYQKKQL